MFKYRISKYDLKNYDENGSYTKNEWTSFSDVGKLFNNKKLTLEDYENVEQKYVSFIIAFFDKFKVNEVKLSNQEPLQIFKCKTFSLKDDWLKIIIKQMLREKFWGKFKTEDFVVYVGYDDYIHIESKVDIEKVLVKLAEKNNLYVQGC